MVLCCQPAREGSVCILSVPQSRRATCKRRSRADDIVFSSPIVHKPYAGKRAATAVLSVVRRVLEDFGYEAELASEDGRNHALLFRARVDGKDLRECDFLHQSEDGLVDQLTVMVRPLSGALALRDRMAAQLGAPEAASSVLSGGDVWALGRSAE